MAKVIIFSRTFPTYHTKAGQPTYFVEKFWKSLVEKPEIPLLWVDYISPYKKEFGDLVNYDSINSKNHTIRSGKRWQKGDYCSPRVWSGKPYRSPMITIAPDTLITDVYDFEIKKAYKELPLDYDVDILINHNLYRIDESIMKEIAKNDGLSLPELLQWFKYPKPFRGQVICWNECVKY